MPHSAVIVQCRGKAVQLTDRCRCRGRVGRTPRRRRCRTDSLRRCPMSARPAAPVGDSPSSRDRLAPAAHAHTPHCSPAPQTFRRYLHDTSAQRKRDLYNTNRKSRLASRMQRIRITVSSQLITSPTGGVRIIVTSLFVCLSVCPLAKLGIFR